MDRRTAITAAVATLAATRVKGIKAVDPDSNTIDLKEGTALVAIRFNDRTFALGFEMIPGEQYQNVKGIVELARVLEQTGCNLAPFI